MVTICTKKFMNTREKLLSYTGRKRNESKDLEEFFKKLKERGDKVGSSRVLSGTTVPNSTFKSIYSIDQSKSKKNDGSPLSAAELEGKKMSVSSIKGLNSTSKTLTKKEEQSSEILIQPDDRRASILSGTGTLEELKELKNLLHKSSYVPKQITRTRRPTIEKIKSAIEKEKLTLIDKNETTIVETVTQSDASTSTLKKKKKKTKTSNAPGSNTSQGTNKKKKPKKKSTSKDGECALLLMMVPQYDFVGKFFANQSCYWLNEVRDFGKTRSLMR